MMMHGLTNPKVLYNIHVEVAKI